MQELQTTYGVDALKRSIAWLGTQVSAATQMDANGDGKIDRTEILSYSLGLLPTIPGILPTFTEAGKEIRDLESSEFDELTDHVLRTDFLPDDRERAEHYVKAVVFYLNMTRNFVRFNIQFFDGEDVRFDPLQGLL